MAGSLFFVLTPAERVALDMIRDERSASLAFLSERLSPVLDDLAQTCQGRVVTGLEAGTSSTGSGRSSSAG